MTPAESTMDIIMDVVCRYYRTTNDILLGKDRTKSVHKARATACWLARHAGLSWPEIAKYMHRDHTSVMSSVDRLMLTSKESSTLIKLLDVNLGAIGGSDVVTVIFNEKTLGTLQELLDSGLWGSTLEDVVERVVCQYLHGQLKREE